MKKQINVRNRDREGTKTLILQAVGKLLAESGYNKLGINAIAREAGVDKVLIYRYFTDLPTLLRTFGQEGDYLSPTTIPPELENAGSLAYGLFHLLTYYQKELQERPITQEIMRWELTENNELIRELIAVRYKVSGERLKFLDDKFGIPQDPDMTAIMTILGAGVIYLILRSKISPAFSGLDFSIPEGWERIDAAISTILHAVLADAAPAAQPPENDSDPQSPD
jgi:AcrR family transcriptional regulator